MTRPFNVNIPCQQRPFFLVFGGLSYSSEKRGDDRKFVCGSQSIGGQDH